MCNVNRKESPFTVTKYPTLVLEDRCRLGNVLSVPVSVTTASISAHGNSKNRTLKNRMSNPSPVKLSITDQSFADPLLGASASFIQRLLEMSTLQEKTVQQEKLKEFKKNRRQEA
ncbi:uncharacterized protein si:ch211-171b20.3 [Clarias gariepinus]|uniref:uncharacterized protein si:ch211-171b20.3 n=1 Tax=Clarias gariepinus TaxID=13013 RepID=UPI00234DB501|nr:uncharacterized protein si:ch211-171b20.3 [Clarias gariepinus]